MIEQRRAQHALHALARVVIVPQPAEPCPPKDVAAAPLFPEGIDSNTLAESSEDTLAAASPMQSWQRLPASVGSQGGHSDPWGGSGSASIPTTVTGFAAALQPSAASEASSANGAKTTKRAARKGTLSLFLSGKLDEEEQTMVTPPATKLSATPGDAWKRGSNSTEVGSVVSMDAILAEATPVPATRARASVLHRAMNTTISSDAKPPRKPLTGSSSVENVAAGSALPIRISNKRRLSQKDAKQRAAAALEGGSPCSSAPAWHTPAASSASANKAPSLSDIMHAASTAASAEQRLRSAHMAAARTAAAPAAPARDRHDPWGVQQRVPAAACELKETISVQQAAASGVRRAPHGGWSRQEGVEIRGLDAILHAEELAGLAQSAAPSARTSADAPRAVPDGPVPRSCSHSAHAPANVAVPAVKQQGHAPGSRGSRRGTGCAKAAAGGASVATVTASTTRQRCLGTQEPGESTETDEKGPRPGFAPQQRASGRGRGRRRATNSATGKSASDAPERERSDGGDSKAAVQGGGRGGRSRGGRFGRAGSGRGNSSDGRGAAASAVATLL